MLELAKEAVDRELSQLETELEAAIQKVVVPICLSWHGLIYLSRLVTRASIFSSLWLCFGGMSIRH
jgi:hypothetical protein